MNVFNLLETIGNEYIMTMASHNQKNDIINKYNSILSQKYPRLSVTPVKDVVFEETTMSITCDENFYSEMELFYPEALV